MRKIATTIAALALAVGGGLVMAPSASAATPCPSGAVCIRETNGSILSRNIFYSYRAHNLSNVTGDRVIVNSQTGGAGFKVCYEYNGGNCSTVSRATGEYAPYNMTPINSIVLVP
ncbi:MULTISPECIES: hypothetical protein [Streptomyces]|uniref:Putative secreted protein n=1 Tax=Streptomyces scabiei (strain 87.22) TaxID=680198 RepID=C9Z9U4_STRSW|nr:MULTISPECIES: hypothetical protein [Streptomyces]KFG09937.1 hypothetical protein IQ61_05555 [Streptomyces scabiei]MBP5896302.1 hypothetical protein [Streptomyces sp. LBUM 1481]MBP5910896.1 hypothetical protein [Streptomyces sp. LBUM 1486]MBP5926639.1 hypothetical protein [Streptomyces sp. LBUM 1483]MDX2540192.1 hypothetical protein [Streptomyces scabiei]